LLKFLTSPAFLIILRQCNWFGYAGFAGTCQGDLSAGPTPGEVSSRPSTGQQRDGKTGFAG
jgi:hypothetical protein